MIERTAHLVALQQLNRSVVVISCMSGRLVASGPNPGEKSKRSKKKPQIGT